MLCQGSTFVDIFHRLQQFCQAKDHLQKICLQRIPEYVNVRNRINFSHHLFQKKGKNPNRYTIKKSFEIVEWALVPDHQRRDTV
jgi:hypothetical protein